MFLIARDCGQCPTCMTQEFMAMAYTKLPYVKVIRFYDGRFEYLSPHKWRNEKDGGGWDEVGLWHERWETCHEGQLNTFKTIKTQTILY